MPRFFNPEDNPWGMFDGGTTWQQLVSAGNVTRLSRNWKDVIRSYGRQYLSAEVLNCQSIDEFIALANVNFSPSNTLCLLPRTELELAWSLFTNYVKDNLIVLSESSAVELLRGQGVIDLDASLDFTQATNIRGYGPNMTLTWPTVGQLSSLEDINQGYKSLVKDEQSLTQIPGLLVEYLNYLDETEQSHRITEIFSSPLEIEVESAENLVGLIVASKDALQYIKENPDNDIYQFFITPLSSRYYYNTPTPVVSQLVDLNLESTLEDGTRVDINQLPDSGLDAEAIAEDLLEVIKDLNAQISSFIDECPLDFTSLFTKYFINLKPEFSVEDRQPNLTTITGPASDGAMSRLATMKSIYAELITPGLNFVGVTASDIPLAWSYPIIEEDIRNMYYPSSNRGTNLRTLYSNQSEVPQLNLSLEDIENLETVFSAIQALQSRLPRLDKTIQDSKNRLEQARARLADLQDTEITRQQVNQAARAARAQVRERIARNIASTEYSIQSTLDNLTNLQSEKRDLIRQYLNE